MGVHWYNYDIITASILDVTDSTPTHTSNVIIVAWDSVIPECGFLAGTEELGDYIMFIKAVNHCPIHTYWRSPIGQGSSVQAR